MTYTKNIWVDQDVERPRTYQEIRNEDGSVTLVDDFGNVNELGTPVNADNMNHIEEGIKETELQGISAYDPNGNYQTGYFTQFNGTLYKSLTDNNQGNQPDEAPENWAEYTSTGTGGGGGAGAPIGSLIPIPATTNYIPDNCHPCNGAEYSGATGEMFNQFYTQFLKPAVTTQLVATALNGTSQDDIQIENGVITYTNNGGCFRIAQSGIDRTDTNPWELHIKIKTKDDVTQTSGICHLGSNQCLLNASNAAVRVSLKVADGEEDVKTITIDIPKEVFTFKPNTEYIILIKYTGNSYAVEVYEGNILAASAVNETANPLSSVGPSYPIEFGRGLSSSSKTFCLIDLKETYANKAGQRVWIGADSTEEEVATESKLQTVTYAEFTSEVSSNGFCDKFAIDIENHTFKMPLIPDGIILGNNTTAPVIGNGYNLALTDGTRLGGIATADIDKIGFNKKGFGSLIGQYTGGNSWGATGAGTLGVPTASTLGSDLYKSGLIAKTDDLFKKGNVKWFVVISTESIPQNAIDWSDYMAALAGKLNADLSNAPTTTRFVIEKSDRSLMPSWYVIYNDGWIEQGGQITCPPNAQMNGTFLKPFSDTNYTFLATDNTTPSNGDLFGFQQGCGKKSNSQFFVRTSNDINVIYSWFACGY